MSDVQAGEFEVRNRHGDVVQRGEWVTVETPDGVESLPATPITMRAGDSIVSATVVSID